LVFSRSCGDKTLALMMVVVVASIPFFIVTVAHNATRGRIFRHHESATDELRRHLPAVKEREGDSDSAWASEYSLSIDRYDWFQFCADHGLMLTHCESCTASACLAFDALDHCWPWKTAVVRRTVSQADKCAAAMRRHSAVSFYPVLRG
jgi:hypothetical protein